MIEEQQRPRLGRGLAALIGDVGEEFAVVDRGRSPRRLPLAFLRPNPRNPRRAFTEADLGELAESIKSKGIIQPIVVRPATGRDAYEIVAGERRWRAAQLAGLHEAPVIVVEASDQEALEIALVENVQRADLNPLEEAQAYERLIGEFGYSQSDLGVTVGKSRSHVANTLRLLKLPERVKALVQEGRLSAGHARALLAVPDPNEVAERILADDLTVRDVEALAQAKKPAARAGAQRPEPDADVRALEKTLAEVLGLAVSLRHRGGEGGELRITYRTLEQLDEVCRRLKG
jgi:ParB family transcriptional regulator, chromosome partitioning protein